MNIFERIAGEDIYRARRLGSRSKTETEKELRWFFFAQMNPKGFRTPSMKDQNDGTE